MLETLTPKQQALIPVVRDEWINRALDGSRRLSLEKARPHVDWLYSLANLAPPKFVVICDSPLGAQFAANMLTNETLQHSVLDSVRASVGASVWDSVQASVRASVLDSVLASVWDSVQASVRASVWDSVQASVRASVLDSVWNSVGDRVQASVWASVWDSVQASVWASVWDSVLASVWDSVQDSVRNSQLTWHHFLCYGLGWDSGWMAFHDYFHRIGHTDHESFKRYRAFLDLGVWDMILFRDCAILVSTPARVRKDVQGRLHNLTGPATEWHDGYRTYAINGVRMDQHADFIEHPETLTAQMALSERNVEIRKGLIQVLGFERLEAEAGATVLDSDSCAGGRRRLLQFSLGEDEPWTVVEVRCPSKRDLHYLRVPPSMTTCHDAVAWTFGFEGDAVSLYRPQVEA